MLKFRTMRGDAERHGEADADWPRRPPARRPDGARRRRGRAIGARGSGGSCAAPRSTSCRSSSTSCAATCRSSARARSGPSSCELFEERIYRYGDRHRVKSGITGWAQVHGLRGQTSLADRVEWDNYYIENWSLWLDLKIALMTVPALLPGSRSGGE